MANLDIWTIIYFAGVLLSCSGFIQFARKLYSNGQTQVVCSSFQTTMGTFIVSFFILALAIFIAYVANPNQAVPTHPDSVPLLLAGGAVALLIMIILAKIAHSNEAGISFAFYLISLSLQIAYVVSLPNSNLLIIPLGAAYFAGFMFIIIAGLIVSGTVAGSPETESRHLEWESENPGKVPSIFKHSPVEGMGQTSASARITAAFVAYGVWSVFLSAYLAFFI